MTDTILIAKKYDVNIGAHPSYPDKENFGRKNISISHADLSNSLMSQIDDLDRIAGSLETSLNHIKLHGALFNFSANDLETASIIIELMKLKYSDKILYVPYGSLISELAIDNNIKIYYEVFLDRNYNNDLSLVSRENNNSMILDYQKMLKRLEYVINDNPESIDSDINGNPNKVILLDHNSFIRFVPNDDFPYNLEEDEGDGIYYDDLAIKISAEGIDNPMLDEILDSLTDQGLVFQPRFNHYKEA